MRYLASAQPKHLYRNGNPIACNEAVEMLRLRSAALSMTGIFPKDNYKTMEKKVLQSIAGVELYPLISFAIFFLFFLGLLLYVVRANRQHMHTMSEMPLLNDDEAPLNPVRNPDALC